LQKLSEVAPFLARIGQPSCLIEIGAGSGGMLAAFCAAAADEATVVSVDLEGGPFGEGAPTEQLRNRANSKPGQTLHLVRGDSHDASVRDHVGGLLPRPADLLLIDGDHTYDGVKTDYELYKALVRVEGMIAFHDILPHDQDPNCEVNRLWQELAGHKQEFVAPHELNQAGGTWGGIGIIFDHH
jgi:cephalosporin hydroxylase